MKYLILLAGGQFGTSLTMIANEMQKVANCPIYIKDTSGSVSSHMYAEQNGTLFNDYSELPKTEYVFILSIPTYKGTDEHKNQFLEWLKTTSSKTIYINCSHVHNQLKYEANLIETFQHSNAIVVHSLQNDPAKRARTNSNTPIIEHHINLFDPDNLKSYWKSTEEQDHVVRWIGRNNAWKGSKLMIEFGETIDDELIPICEGLLANIAWQTIVYRKDGSRRKVVSFFRPEKELNERTSKPSDYGNEELNKGTYLYKPYIRNEGLERMSKSMFASNLYNFEKKPEIYGFNIEYTSIEIISVGSIPIFHKHWGDNYYHRKTGNPFSQNKNIIWLDNNNFAEVRNQLIELKNNPSKRNEMREYNLEYLKEHLDNKKIFNELIQKIKTHDNL